MRLEQGLEAGEAADEYRDTAFNHAPQRKPRDFRVEALSISDDDPCDGNTDDEYAQTQYGEQAELVLPRDLDACDY